MRASGSLREIFLQNYNSSNHRQLFTVISSLGCMKIIEIDETYHFTNNHHFDKKKRNCWCNFIHFEERCDEKKVHRLKRGNTRRRMCPQRTSTALSREVTLGSWCLPVFIGRKSPEQLSHTLMDEWVEVREVSSKIGGRALVKAQTQLKVSR